jgi:hypothetical protein
MLFECHTPDRSGTFLRPWTPRLFGSWLGWALHKLNCHAGSSLGRAGVPKGVLGPAGFRMLDRGPVSPAARGVLRGRIII